jgi:hypothetical protein
MALDVEFPVAYLAVPQRRMRSERAFRVFMGTSDGLGGAPSIGWRCNKNYSGALRFGVHQMDWLRAAGFEDTDCWYEDPRSDLATPYDLRSRRRWAVHLEQQR